jgi:hypothetical protein
MRRLALFIVIICGLSLCHQTALADETSVILINHTGAAMTALRFSPSLADDWSDNLLEQALENDDEVEIPFAADAETELWDMKTTDQNGVDTEWPGLAPAETRQVVLSFEDGEPVLSYQ